MYTLSIHALLFAHLFLREVKSLLFAACLHPVLMISTCTTMCSEVIAGNLIVVQVAQWTIIMCQISSMLARFHM